jgi:hypothetical protein
VKLLYDYGFQVIYHLLNFPPAPVLPAGRIFGRKTQKGQKSGSAGQISAEFSADFVQKGPKNGPSFWKVCFPIFILSNSRPRLLYFSY